jgi:hypothetical protein
MAKSEWRMGSVSLSALIHLPLAVRHSLILNRGGANLASVTGCGPPQVC